MSLEQGFCAVCDHKIVPGVACDGMPDECPFHVVLGERQHRTSAFAATVDSVTDLKDFDSVKSIN